MLPALFQARKQTNQLRCGDSCRSSRYSLAMCYYPSQNLGRGDFRRSICRHSGFGMLKWGTLATETFVDPYAGARALLLRPDPLSGAETLAGPHAQIQGALAAETFVDPYANTRALNHGVVEPHVGQSHYYSAQVPLRAESHRVRTHRAASQTREKRERSKRRQCRRRKGLAGV